MDAVLLALPTRQGWGCAHSRKGPRGLGTFVQCTASDSMDKMRTHHRRGPVPAGCQRLPLGANRLRPGVLGRGGAAATPGGGVSRALGSGVLLTGTAVAWARCGCEPYGARPRSVSYADPCVA